MEARGGEIELPLARGAAGNGEMNLPLLLFLPGCPKRHRKNACDSNDNRQQCCQRQTLPQDTTPERSSYGSLGRTERLRCWRNFLSRRLNLKAGERLPICRKQPDSRLCDRHRSQQSRSSTKTPL